VETITVAAQRIPGTNASEMALFIGVAFVILAVAWMVLSGLKRNREQQPRV
jgi:chromate transport protein ChrA